MSLINEALKRTRDQSFHTGTSTAAPSPSYRLEHNRPVQSVRLSVIAAALAGGFVVAGVVVFIVQYRTALPVSVPPPIVVAPAEPAPQPVVIATEVATRLNEQLAAPAPAPPAEPELPKLVLQGISRFGADREAMINGATVRVGDEVAGARVVAIESRAVRLTYRGQPVVLPMP